MNVIARPPINLLWLPNSLLVSRGSQSVFPHAFAAYGSDHGTDGVCERSASDTSCDEFNFGEPPLCGDVDRSSPRLSWPAWFNPALIWVCTNAVTSHLPRIVFPMQAGNVSLLLTRFLNPIVLNPIAAYLILHTSVLSGGDGSVKLVQWMGCGEASPSARRRLQVHLARPFGPTECRADGA